MSNKISDVDTDNGNDDTEQRQDRNLAHKSHSHENPNKHDDEENGTVDSVIVERTCRIRYGGKYCGCGDHIFLNNKKHFLTTDNNA